MIQMSVLQVTLLGWKMRLKNTYKTSTKRGKGRLEIVIQSYWEFAKSKVSYSALNTFQTLIEIQWSIFCEKKCQNSLCKCFKDLKKAIKIHRQM